MSYNVDVTPYLEKFASSISNQQLGLVLYSPEKDAQPTRCFKNIINKVRHSGGRVQCGWMFQSRLVAEIPGAGYLLAIHHAVWHSPIEVLTDITPFHSDSKHHPLTVRENILFLVSLGKLMPSNALKSSRG